jgi:hypothetical protein
MYLFAIPAQESELKDAIKVILFFSKDSPRHDEAAFLYQII